MATGHTITVEQGTEHVRVIRDGQVIAHSHRPLLLVRETGIRSATTCRPRTYAPTC